MLKLKQIKDPVLKQEYFGAGLLWYDFTPLNVYWKAPYWRVRIADRNYTYPKLCVPGENTLPPNDYMCFIAVE